jgi:hypothetical protein
VVTNPAANQGKGIRIPDNLHRFIEFPFRGRDDVPRNIHPDGAGFAAGRPPVGNLSIYDPNYFPIDHLGNKVALLMTAEANGAGLHYQISLSRHFLRISRDSISHPFISKSIFTFPRPSILGSNPFSKLPFGESPKQNDTRNKTC